VKDFRLNLIPQFLHAEGLEKESIAEKMFLILLRWREIGFLKNNPNSAKEVSFYRAKAIYHEDQVKALNEQVRALNSDITKLRVGMGAIK
jgi:hypothetical protein